MKPWRYGIRSENVLATVDPALCEVFRHALPRSPYDIALLYGWRDQKLQDSLVAQKTSRTPWPFSMHNVVDANGKPNSQAVDFAPIVDGEIYWKDTHIFAAIAGVVMASAEQLQIPITWGGDWDSDGQTTDQTLLDWGHVQKARH